MQEMNDIASIVMACDTRVVRRIASKDIEYKVGSLGVTKIECYEEHGQMAFVPYFAVYRGKHLWLRVPAEGNVVEYVG